MSIDNTFDLSGVRLSFGAEPVETFHRSLIGPFEERVQYSETKPAHNSVRYRAPARSVDRRLWLELS